MDKLRASNPVEAYRQAKRRAFVFEEIDCMINRIKSAAEPGCRDTIEHHIKGLRRWINELEESE